MAGRMFGPMFGDGLTVFGGLVMVAVTVWVYKITGNNIYCAGAALVIMALLGKDL
jgi:hypothetical protein